MPNVCKFDIYFFSDVQLSTRAHILKIDSGDGEKKLYHAQFDSLLMGHDDWVHSVDWMVNGDNLLLASASSDKSVMVWAQDAESKIWVNKRRVGDVGGNTLGFYNVKFVPDGIIGHSYNGSLHIWDLEGSSKIGISGHFGAVKDIAWDAKGQYLVSASLDETTRLWAPWKRDGEKEQWHEIARPQIHGYPLTRIAFYGTHSYICAADEKIIRVFNAPRTFDASLHYITGNAVEADEGVERPTGASQPALGLSNKAVVEDVDAESDPLKRELREPPLEGHLLQYTLWPEINKLYGHGYEVMAVAASHDGKLFASACKATKPEFAAVY
jgi:elongator complex protein 2